MVENLMKSHPRALKSSPRVAQRDLLGSLGTIFGAFGSVMEALGTVLGASWEALGVVLESCWSTFGGSEALGKRFGSDFANIAKPSKTMEGIAKMEVPRSRSGWKIVKISIKRQSLVEILMKSHPQAFKSSPRVAQESSKSLQEGPRRVLRALLSSQKRF